MTHIEFIYTVTKAREIAKVINDIVGADRWSIGGSMVLELHMRLARDVHDIDLIFEFENRNNAMLAYQLLDRVLDTFGKEHKKSYANVEQDVWSLEFRTPLMPQPVNILFREIDRANKPIYNVDVLWQSLATVIAWKKRWNREKDRKDLEA